MANTWNEVGTLMGPQGPRGEAGEAGARGGSVRMAGIDVAANSDVAFSALSPSDGVQVGDTVVDAQGEVFTVASVNAGASTAHVGAAIEGVSLKGPRGEAGEQGPKGEDGTSITVKGSVTTSADLPADAAVGDTYVTSSDGHMWVKTSAAGDSQWTDLGEMKGPKGDKGDQGIQGPKGDQGDKGDPGAAGAAGPGIVFGQGAPTEAMQVGTTYVDTADGFKVYQYGEGA